MSSATWISPIVHSKHIFRTEASKCAISDNFNKQPPAMDGQIHWKEQVVCKLQEFEERTVHFLVGMTDDQKKAVLQCAHDQDLCTEIPRNCKSLKHIMKSAYFAQNKRAFIMHAPETDESKAWEFYAAVETLKDGFIGCFHGRTYHQRYFDSPNVMVFIDNFPKLKYIKPDCWLFWQVADDTQLVSVRHPKMPVS